MTTNIMTKSLLRSPKALQELLQHDQFGAIAQKIEAVSEVHFIGTGSSNHASLGAQAFLKPILDIDVFVHRPTEHFVAKEDAVLVFVSQTGTSLNVLQSLQQFPNHLKIGVSQDPQAAIPLACDFAVDLLIGEEPCNAKTVGVSTTFLSLVLLGLALTKQDQSKYVEMLSQQVQQQETIIHEGFKQVETINAHDYNHMFIITSPELRSVGEEAALKYLEVALQPAVFCDVDEFSHGFNRMITEQSLILYISSEQSSFDDALQQFVQETKASLLKLQPATGVLAGLGFVHAIIAKIADQMDIDPNLPLYDWFNEAVKTRI